MASGRKNRIFEELNLLDQEEDANPYVVLGLSQEFASELLEEDPSGEALQFAVNGLYRTLSKRYHPDNPTSGNADRFKEMDAANLRVSEASVSSLRRWLSSGRPIVRSSEIAKKMQAEKNRMVDYATELLNSELELGNHPKHFSKLEDAQGILLQRARTTLLLRPSPSGTYISKGTVTDLTNVRRSLEETQAFDFQGFLSRNESFGLAPNTDIVTYIDERGRASILTPDLEFIMDVTDPVEERRRQRANTTNGQRPKEVNRDISAWSDTHNPILFITKTPSIQGAVPPTQLVTFSTAYDGQSGTQEQPWNIPLNVVGSISDKTFFNKTRKSADTASAALSGSSQQRAKNHFNLLATQTRQLVEDNPGYTPLIQGGNSLLLYDAKNKMPVVTDAKVVGMIGSNSRAE